MEAGSSAATGWRGSAISAGAGRVIDLAGDLRRVIARDHPGLPEPKRAISAHLTVARRADDRLISTLSAERLGPLRASWRADRIDLVRSHLGRTGARYERVHEAWTRGSSMPSTRRVPRASALRCTSSGSSDEEASMGRQTKFILAEDRIPHAWYNITADLPVAPPPSPSRAPASPSGLRTSRRSSRWRSSRRR